MSVDRLGQGDSTDYHRLKVAVQTTETGFVVAEELAEQSRVDITEHGCIISVVRSRSPSLKSRT